MSLLALLLHVAEAPATKSLIFLTPCNENSGLHGISEKLCFAPSKPRIQDGGVVLLL
jgi:hypothetical protein